MDGSLFRSGAASRCARRRASAFSLIEILTTVALLAFIILGLVAMFNQTRRAFTSSITQVDVLESGRSAADIVTREMEQIAAAGSYSVTNFCVDSPVRRNGYAYLTQPYVDPSESRTNNLQQVVFVTRNNLQWSVVGYRLLPPTSSDPQPALAGIGTLYRYNVPNIALTNIPFLTNAILGFFSVLPTTNFSRLIDGVVDFRIRTLDANGIGYSTNNALGTLTATNNYTANDQFFTSFTSYSLPAYVEVELGVLEDRALAHYQALAIPPTAVGPGYASWGYLTNHAGAVHIFRQRITVRNSNPAAF